MRGYLDGQEEEDDDTPAEEALVRWIEDWLTFE